MRKVLLAFALVPSLAVVSAVPALAKGPSATICSDVVSDGVGQVTYVVTKGPNPGTYMATYADNGDGSYSRGDKITSVSYLGPSTSCPAPAP
jgi:hypothetical protein